MKLGRLSEFFVFEVFRMNELEHRVSKQERVLTVIEPPRHFVKVGRKMLRQDPTPSSHNPVPSAPRLAAFDLCGAASVPFPQPDADLFITSQGAAKAGTI